MNAVAVVGSGVIGRSWIRVFTRAGHEVRVWDPSAHAIDAALRWHSSEARRDGRPGVGAVAAPDLVAATAGVTWVQENGPETLEGKRAIFAELDRVAPAMAILASSTSTLDMTEVARGLPGAHRCVVAHPVNPPHVVPVVEVLGGRESSAETVERAVEFLRRVGQVPVRMQQYVPGFLLNRMQAALIREALSLLDRGVADVNAIDTVIRDGLGLRWALMGPFGVANTNADGGAREYFTRYAGSFRWLMDDLGATPALDAPQIERIGEGTDAMVGDTPPASIREWRDRMLERLVALKRSEPHP